MRRIRCGTAPGAVSRAITWVIVALGLSWLTWPVWGSLTAPDRETVTAETPALLFALAGLIVLLAWGGSPREVPVWNQHLLSRSWREQPWEAQRGSSPGRWPR